MNYSGIGFSYLVLTISNKTRNKHVIKQFLED